ncbi:hypothetical protein EJ02DRAFT_250619 [Clathrospora elynae]|uniref:DUF7730 domain-containing protein n=1 Tax=Clathrospora elynae TaxID=706981 RepID=A0A6A5T3T2_9PLEO|nr:hypothetical protein EJ02DRAFT_250619 [Clathrospora elynae]
MEGQEVTRPSLKRARSLPPTDDDGVIEPPAKRFSQNVRTVLRKPALGIKGLKALWVPTPDCQRNNLLLRLPAELRNRIYELVLGGRTYKFKDTIQTRQARLDTKGEEHIFSLLYVCRQIHFETALLPYTINTFSFRDIENSLDPFLRQRSPAQMRSIHLIELITYQAGTMWAAQESLSRGLSKEFRVLNRLPNLQRLHVVVDTMESLYVCWGALPFSHVLAQKNLENWKTVVAYHCPEVIFTSWWA